MARSERTEEIEKEPWWHHLHNPYGMVTRAVESSCCRYPVTNSIDFVVTRQLEYRCLKCDKVTDKFGNLQQAQTDAERIRAQMPFPQVKTFGKAPSHGLARKDMMATDAYQKTQPEFPDEEVSF